MTARACPTCGTHLPADAPESLCPRCLLRVALEPNHSPSPGVFTPPAPKELAPHFPHLEILGLIGHGGMGAVYRARQVKLDRLVALKILPRQAGADPTFAERFIREARALARLQHPHVVTVHDFGEAGGYYYLLMEHVDGFNLRQMMKARAVAPGQALPILTALADALAYAHENEVVHRDLKPENVLVDRRGQVKLADFGLAKLVAPDPASLTLTGAGDAMGTPHYMAPEQLERPQEVDHRADIYALGVLGYELLTGELPLGRFDPPSKRSGVRPGADEVVMKALERDPARRYQSAAEMAAALRALTGRPDGMAALAAPRPEPEPTLERTNEALAIAGLALGLVGVVAGIIATKAGWFAVGLLAVERVAAAIKWRPQRRYLVGLTLALGGLAASLAIISVRPSHWPMILLIWFWYGDHVYKFFKGINPHAGEVDDEDVAEKAPDWHDLAPRDRDILKAIYGADPDSIVYYPKDADGETLAKLRDANEMLPEERVLAHVPLAKKAEAGALVFTSHHVYFPATQHGEPVRLSLSYEALPGRTFVNHGRSVYAGDGIALTPENGTSCAALAALLQAVRRAVTPPAG